MGESRPPPFVICHLCGRKYGTKSIEIHVPQCQRKWHEENKKLPKHLRRTLPKQPDYGLLQSGANADMIDQLNDMSFKAAQAQLIPCENCGRTFYPEKLPVHQRSCTVERPAARPKAPPKHSNISTSLRNTNTHSDESDIKHNDIKNKPKDVSDNEYIASILCTICLQHIPAKKIQTHLVRCNEEKIKSIQQTEKTKNISSPEESKRPRTRTIRRRSPPKIPNNGTYDIIEPNTNRSYNVDVPAVISNSELNNFVTCELCNRKFTDDRIDQHKVICSNLKKKQRKVFDSSKQRMQGIEIAKRNKSSRYKEHPSVPKSNWKQKHEEFIQSIRAAKTVTAHMAKGGKASDIPPPPPSLNADYVYCQHCDRRFNPEVALRHIPKCATIVNRPAPPKKKALDNYQSPSNKRDLKSGKIREKKTSTDNLNGILNGNIKKADQFSPKKLSGLSKNDEKKIKVNEISSTGYRSPRLEKRYESFEGRSTGKYKDSPHDKSLESDNSKSLKKKYSKSYNTAYSYNSVKEGSSRKSSGGFIF